MPKRAHVASPDEIKFTRDGDVVVVEYADPKLVTTHPKLGKDRLESMTDQQLLEFWNDHVEATEAHVRNFEYTAVEVPVGKPPGELLGAGRPMGAPSRRLAL